MITAAKLKTRTAKDLAAMAKKKKVPGWHAMRKDELIQSLVKQARSQARKAAKKEDVALGWLVNIATSALEQADTRGWIFLPGQIFMLKAHVEPGPQILTMRFKNRSGEIVDEKTLDLDVGENGVEFVSVRSFR